MSGGSFNYLCHKDAEGIMASGMSDLRDMAEALADLGHYAKDPAERTATLLARIEEVQRELDAEVQTLAPVWHALEWWRSCDWGSDQFWIAVGEWRAIQATLALGEGDAPA